MLFWYGHGGGWGWVGATIISLLIWVAFIVGTTMLLRSLFRSGDARRGGRTSVTMFPPFFGGVYRSREFDTLEDEFEEDPRLVSAEQILSERFARGEIDDAEFHARLTALRAAHDPGARARAAGVERLPYDDQPRYDDRRGDGRGEPVGFDQPGQPGPPPRDRFLKD